MLYIWALFNRFLMENKTLHNISLARFKSLFPDSPSIGLGDDFYILDAHLREHHNPVSHPCRFDGFMLIYCVKGRMSLSVNLSAFELEEGMLFMNLPGNILRLNEIIDTPQEDVRCVCLAISKEFLSGMKLDMNKFFNEGVSMLDRPTLKLKTSDMDMVCKTVNMMIDVLKNDLPCKKDMILSYLSGMFYLVMGRWSEECTKEKTPSQSTRSRMVFDKFMKLVTEYHTKYRNVGFYADKLCLTPKYLSKVIKNATGRSAPDWIDSYVILEAKNLLKYSNITIKEVVYRLNFPNQSVFYKFFKARTGMTPTEYRNS